MDADDAHRRCMAPASSHTSPVAEPAICRQAPEVGAVCPNWARTDLCGGCPVTGIPTAISPRIIEIIQSILCDAQTWPLQDFLGTDSDGDHARQCQTSCYRCIQRYGKRRYHGLLDWRLGLSCLRAMASPKYSCGLDDSDLDLPEISGWMERAPAPRYPGRKPLDYRAVLTSIRFVLQSGIPRAKYLARADPDGRQPL